MAAGIRSRTAPGAALFCLALSALSLSACIQVMPIPMNAQVGSLALQRIPLRVAVVVPDPPTHRVMYTPPAMTGRSQPVDQTEQMNESLWPLGGELARATREAFSQVFEQATSLRSLPMPGEYDAVIQSRINVVRIVGFMSGGLSTRAWQDLSFEWGITVLDDEGVPILVRQGTTPIQKIDVKPAFSMKFYANDLGSGSSELLASMVREWGTLLAYSPELRDHADRMQW